MGWDSDDQAPMVLAVACDTSGRSVYVSLDSIWFRRVDHFPDTPAEAIALYSNSVEPKVLKDQLQARFRDQVVVLSCG